MFTGGKELAMWSQQPFVPYVYMGIWRLFDDIMDVDRPMTFRELHNTIPWVFNGYENYSLHPRPVTFNNFRNG